jgi:hypothetical protein
MTETELIEAIIGYNETMPAWLGLYITTLSGYLIVAYIAGKDLTRSQMVIISSCFAIFTSLCAYAAIANSTRVLEFTSELYELNPDRHYAMRVSVLYTIKFVLYTGILVALKFMWDIRHPKAE